MHLLTFCFSLSYSRAVWKVSENSSRDPHFGCGQVKAAPTKHCVKQFAARERFLHLESRRSKTKLPPQTAVLLLQDVSLFPKWRSALCFYTWTQPFGNSSVTSCAHRCRRTWTDCMFAVGLQVFVNPHQLVQIQLRLIGDRFPSTRQTVQSPCTNVINQRCGVLGLCPPVG